jgi:hypothetical protein
MACGTARNRAALIFALSVLCVSLQVASQSALPAHPISYLPKRDANARPDSSVAPVVATNPLNIPYLGGQVLPDPTVYALWWGGRANFPADEADGIDDTLKGGFEGTPYLALADQYLFGAKAKIRFGGNLFDDSTPPVQIATSIIVNEVYNVLANNGKKPDPNALYAVYSSISATQYSYCAFHDYGIGPDGTAIHIMFVPSSNDEPLCWVQPPELSCNQHSNGLQAAANSTAHELMESITDPNGDAWVSLPTGNEIGDPCNFTYKRCVTLANETTWQLQEIWSNKVSACVQGTGTSE